LVEQQTAILLMFVTLQQFDKEYKMETQHKLAQSRRKSVPSFAPVQPVGNDLDSHVPQLSGVVHRKLSDPRQLTPQDILALQRTAGNQAVQRLLYPNTPQRPVQLAPNATATLATFNDITPPQEEVPSSRESALQRSTPQISGGMPGKKLHTDLAPVVQRKAYTGSNYQEADPGKLKNDKEKALAQDDDTRRFKDEAELQQFAKGKTTHIGLTEENDWVRVDEFTVLGENHGAPIAPNIINAIGTSRFRYEGFSHRSEARKFASPSLRWQVHTSDKKKLETKGITNTGGDHAAEHILPKYARAFPDIINVVELQAQNLRVNNQPLIPGRKWDAGYGLNKVLVSTLLDALRYARSYKYKWSEHPLKAFANANSDALDQSIKLLQKAADKNEIPDLGSMPIRSQLGMLKSTYFTLAREKLGVDDDKMTEFKKELDLKNESKVTNIAEAKENDYLRDYSMFETIKQAKNAGDLLFVIGDAHRGKLKPLLDKNNITSMRDKDFLAKQKAANSTARSANSAPLEQPKAKDEQPKTKEKWTEKFAKFFRRS
jgi:hypothetical protein